MKIDCDENPELMFLQYSLAVKFVFFFLNFLVYFNFTMVARKWPQYVSHWENAERKLMELQVMQHQDVRLRRRVKTIFVFIMFLAFSNIYDLKFVLFAQFRSIFFSFFQLSIILALLRVFIYPNLVGTSDLLKRLTFVNRLQTFLPCLNSISISGCSHKL